MKIINRVIPTVLSLILVLTMAVAGSYTGPDREVRDTAQDTVTMTYQSGPNPRGINSCTFNTGAAGGSCSTIPSWEQQEYWCGSGTSYPSGWCSTHPGQCWTGKITSTYCATTNLPEATVNGSLGCATAGNNGWCRGGATVSLTAHEPLAGERIQYIEGNLGAGLFTVCDPADNANVSCSWTPAEGNNTLSFWAHSSYGDTSDLETLACKVDTIAPESALDIDVSPASNGPNANGWYRGGTTITLNALGTDSTSGVSGRYIQVDGGALQSGPVFLFQEGIFSARAVVQDNAGNQTSTTDVEFKIDAHAPSGYDLFPNPLPLQPSGWYTSPVTIDILGYDDFSGYDYTEYIWRDQGSVHEYSGIMPVTIGAEGRNWLGTMIYDKAGNILSVAHSIQIDLSAPTVSPKISGTSGLDGWYVSPVALNANATDSASGICGRLVNVDASGWQDLGYLDVPLPFSSQGTHSFTAQSRDCVGRTSPVSAALAFKIDSVAPVLNKNMPIPDGQNGWHIHPVDVGVSGADATSGLMLAQVRAGNGVWQDGGLTLAAEGVTYLAFRTQDKAGNLSTATAQVALDLSDPSISLANVGASGLLGWFVSPVRATVTAADAVSGLHKIQMRRDGAAWDLVDHLDLTADGTTLVEALATDLAGRQTLIEETVNVDQTPPTLHTLIPVPDGKNGWYIDPLLAGVYGDDLTSGILLAQARVDGGVWLDGSISVVTEGLHELDFRTRDQAGNWNQTSVQVGVDLTDPALSLATSGTPGLAGWHISPITVTASATDAVSGLNELRFRQDTSSWQVGDRVVLATDGISQVDFEAEDMAGRKTLGQQLVKIDQIPPVLAPVASGPLGLNAWYTGPVTLNANATDTTSGIAGVQPAPVVLFSEDGRHTLNWSAQDVAGNIATGSLTIQIDQTPPVILFDPVADVLTGEITLSGKAADITSGLAKVEVSTTLGLIWEEVPLRPDGSWSLPWNTLMFPGGQALVKARAYDLAGNLAMQDLNATIANRPPDIRLTERWYIWESGEMRIDVGDVPYERVVIKICDPQSRWQCVVWSYGPENTPTQVVWDRHFGSIVAPIGEYPVEATIIDILGRSASARGLILIPQPWTPTPSSTMTPTVTLTPISTQTGTLASTQTAQPTEIVDTPMPTPGIPSEAVQNAVQVIQEEGSLGSYLVLIGFSFVLGASASRDRRPKEWRRLASELNLLITTELKGEKKKND
jgi:hypothetical protein